MGFRKVVCTRIDPVVSTKVWFGQRYAEILALESLIRTLSVPGCAAVPARGSAGSVAGIAGHHCPTGSQETRVAQNDDLQRPDLEARFSPAST
jgi:hypothetical protein